MAAAAAPAVEAAPSTSSRNRLGVPWVEKYRPRKVDDLSHQDAAKKLLRRVLETGNMPHLLFYGPPGTGKTSAILALAHQLFGREEYRNRVLELNASDDRGIGVVREKIKNYTKTSVSRGKKNPETGREMPPWKIVILDEADLMTQDAQAALRRIIEAYSKTTRFVIICNYVHRIIDPIFSRCSRYRFQPISREAQRERLEHICKSESVAFDEKALDAILVISRGDLRRAVTLLQSSASLCSRLTEEAVYEVAGYPSEQIGLDILQACQGSVDMIKSAVSELIAQGWDVAAVLSQMMRLVIVSKALTDVQKARISFEIGAKDIAILQGANEYLQMMSLCFRIRSFVTT